MHEEKYEYSLRQRLEIAMEVINSARRETISVIISIYRLGVIAPGP